MISGTPATVDQFEVFLVQKMLRLVCILVKKLAWFSQRSYDSVNGPGLARANNAGLKAPPLFANVRGCVERAPDPPPQQKQISTACNSPSFPRLGFYLSIPVQITTRLVSEIPSCYTILDPGDLACPASFSSFSSLLLSRLELSDTQSL